MEFKTFEIGQKVTMKEEKAEQYGVTTRDVFYVRFASTCVAHVPGHDEVLDGVPLYDLVDEDGDDFANSVFGYELEKEYMNKYEAHIMKNGALPDFSFPAYPIIYITKGSGEVLCGDCASDVASEIDSHHLHMEGAPLLCDECAAIIESAYGVPEGDEDEDGYVPRDAYGEPLED